MKWVDVFGAPGVGKSTVCNLLWPPSVPWDGKRPPDEWGAFLDCAARLSRGIERGRALHWGAMFTKAMFKTATLSRMPRGGVYAGVGFAMRGIDLAWRLRRPDDAAEYFRLMPVSIGVAVFRAPVAVIEARNRVRGKTKPSRELSHLAKLMERPCEIAVDVLKGRGVPVLEVDTLQPPDSNRARIVSFASDLAAAA